MVRRQQRRQRQMLLRWPCCLQPSTARPFVRRRLPGWRRDIASDRLLSSEPHSWRPAQSACRPLWDWLAGCHTCCLPPWLGSRPSTGSQTLHLLLLLLDSCQGGRSRCRCFSMQLLSQCHGAGCSLLPWASQQHALLHDRCWALSKVPIGGAHAACARQIAGS